MKKSASVLVLLLILCFLVSAFSVGVAFSSSENWNWVELERITGDNYYVCETEPFTINSSVAVWRIVWEYTPRTDVPEHSTGITINLYAGVSGDDKLLEISRMGIYNGDEDCRYFHKEGVFRLKISSNTQNFTVRIEQSMGYIPEPPSDNWVEVTRFIGTKGFITDVFVCDHIEWRIRWEFDPGNWLFADLHTLQVTTYKEGESAKYFNQILEVPSGNLNGVELLNQSGTFYLDIGSGLIDSYTIIVEENIDSIPEFPSWTSIYIRADGSVDGTDKIQRDGNVYTFTGNIYGLIVVERYNIVIDGGGYILEGTGAAIDGPARNIGIDLAWMRNVTIRNVSITSFDYGIRISVAFNNTITGNDIKNNGYGIKVILNSSGNSVYENNITANSKGGIWLNFAKGNTISSNQITNNNARTRTKGIWIYSSSNEIISENYVANNCHGIFIDRSPYTTLRNNTMVDNEQNFSVEGTDFNHFVNYVDVLNTADAKPIYYWINQHGKTVLSDGGYVALVNCTNITVQNLNLSGNGQGILLASTTKSTITNTTITNTNDGVYLHSSSNNSIIENYLTNNGQGISYSSSCDNIISGNHVTNNWCAIRLGGSSNNTISTNNIKNNSCLIIFEYSSNNNSVNRNLIENENNTCCYISFLESSNNIFFHNNFINNTEHVTDLGMSAYWFALSINIWDDGKEGNYWSNYNGTDNDGDGIGDTPYVINEYNQDNFPLMKQFSQWHAPKEQPEPFPATWVIITIVIIAVIGAVFLVYLVKSKKTTKKAK